MYSKFAPKKHLADCISRKRQFTSFGACFGRTGSTIVQVEVAKSLSQPVLGSTYLIWGGISSFLAEKFAISFLLFTTGLYGASMVKASILPKSNPLNHAAFLMLSVPPFFMGKRSV